MKKLLLFALVLGLFAGCKKTEVYPKEDYFYGKWQVVLQPNFTLELTSSNTANTSYIGLGLTIPTLGTGTWSYDTSTKNLKVIISKWLPVFPGPPMPDGKSLDAIIEPIDASNFYLTTSGARWKYTKIP